VTRSGRSSLPAARRGRGQHERPVGPHAGCM